jgi:hypothetical protein
VAGAAEGRCREGENKAKQGKARTKPRSKGEKEGRSFAVVVLSQAAAAGSEQRLLICCSLGVSKQKIRQATAKGKGEAGPGLGFE